jgi:serine/threonine protein kinase
MEISFIFGTRSVFDKMQEKPLKIKADGFNLYLSFSPQYPGHYGDESSPAAVQCIPDVHYNLYENEIKELRKINHTNVVRCFATTSVQGLHYIAMEKGYCNLGQFMESNSENTAILIKLLHDSCLGVQCLHKRRIIHKNINPSNILVVKDNNGFVGKLSGFAISQTLPFLQSDWCSGPCGTKDFMPPEVLNALDDNKEATYCRETDVYSLGITMFNILSRGEYPGGVRSMRLKNSIYGNLNLDHWQVACPPVVQFQSCIERMVCYEIKNRASIDFVLNHPWSWNSKKNLAFIVATAVHLDSRTSDAQSDRETLRRKLSLVLQMNQFNPGLGWMHSLCKNVRDYLASPCKSQKRIKRYNFMDYSKLIELIRDADQNFDELPNDLKSVEVFGVEKGTYIKYLLTSF